ncbi:SDR family oxidoreductase [Oleiharenicola lentus]|uniref:SDR family oxidoreductase n=1 Tax=Oleiharenicola lentus TaxID=2508720 RepID=UPI003F6761F7
MSSTILITGANRGLGLELAIQFAVRGWTVFAGCREPAAAAELLSLAVANAAVKVLELDVTRDDQVVACLARVREHTPSLDVLVNNAGINPEPRTHTVIEIDVASVVRTLDVNTVGPLRVLQAAFPLLKQGRNPRVINISSGAGSLTRNSARSPAPAYCISKAALNQFTRRAALDLAPHGITVVAITPGWVRTTMGGPGADLPVSEAVASLARTIENLQPAHTGEWVDRHGQPSAYAW